jgi:hypothetical protein
VSVQQLSAFIDSALSGVSRELVTRHLAASGACRDKHAARKAADEALRQALAWTPNERTLEGWSSRVEMCITAERKGLPVPEFTPTLLPVIAPVTPTSLPRMRELLESARGAMLHHARGPAPVKPGEPAAASTPGETSRPVQQAPELETTSEPAPAHDATPDSPVAGLEEETPPAIESAAGADDAPTQEPNLDAEPATIEADDAPTQEPSLDAEPATIEPDDAVVSGEPAALRDEEADPEPEPEPEAQVEPELDIESTLQIEPVFVPEPEAPAGDEPATVAAPRLQIEPAFVPEREVPVGPEPLFVADPETQLEIAFVPAPEVPAEPVSDPEPGTPIRLGFAAQTEDAAEPKRGIVAEPESQLELVLAPEPEVPAEHVFVAEAVTHEAPVSRQEVPPDVAPAPVREPEPVAARDPQPADRSIPRRDRDPYLELKPPPEWSVPELSTPPLEGAVPPVLDIASAPAETDTARARRRRDSRSLLVACSVLLLVLLTSQLMPEVIRIPLPERWGLRVPRVEFVRGVPTPAEDAAGPRAAELRLAARQPVVPELVPENPPRTPADSAVAVAATLGSGAEATLEPATPATASATLAPPAGYGTWERGGPAPPAAARTTPASAAASSAPVEASPALVPDSPATIIPVRVSKTVHLSSPTSRKPPEPEGDEQWPLLCGEVIDSEGHPVEGARVQLVSFALTVRTDRRGRFCVACPPGVRALRVEASGFPVVNRTVELSGELVETRIALPPAR